MITVGVDLGIHKLSIACAQGEELIIAETFISNSQGRASELRWLGEMATMAAERWGTHQAWIEKTIIGNNRKYSIQLAETMGAVMAGLAQLPIRIETVDNTVWKK